MCVVDSGVLGAGVVILYMPYIHGGEKGTWTCGNGIYNTVCILFIFPFIVSMGV